MSEDKWISRDPKTKKLAIRFRVQGFSKQFYIASGLKDTKRNREIVRSKRDAIVNDITLERFDSTLESYRFRAAGKAPAVAIAPQPPNYQYDLQQLWERYTGFQSSQLEKTTILTKYYSIANHIERLPTRSLDDAAKIREWALDNLTHYMAWELLNCLSRCCSWANDSALIIDNPFEKLKIKKPKQRSDDDDRRAFTLEQRDLIIETFENHPLHSHYAPLVKFLFLTGARPGEAFALTWGDISADCCKVNINKSCNGHRVRKGTKNGKKRVFPSKPGSKLQKTLLEHRPALHEPADLVFLSKAGKPMSSSVMVSFWHEWKSGSREKTYKYPGVVKSLADAGNVPYLKPYATRHTFATWAISNGISPDKVALWIGDTVETVLKYYCHPEIVSSECPDF
ncbi:tyrosine-type recombinase/integrase [Nostocaceae cyanobacterium CENA369]|uniref:Tyrosine-type recombinase/integrase n=1 Tax=Dendronalium phyllosphericum CENA369 TaxID=1725256 RepID=A0A8J7LET6_9NOST|nr:site-specific integrase [Dendronalium phyllosphericum]MBH8575272.1 tyrosine-type recombinase/integrase [Dendronalium phyllosphericum CENA369]